MGRDRITIPTSDRGSGVAVGLGRRNLGEAMVCAGRPGVLPLGDFAGARTIFDELARPLGTLRRQLGADLALVVRHCGDGFQVLGADAAGPIPVLVNEPITVRTTGGRGVPVTTPAEHPRALAGIELRSRMRGLVLELSSALIISWHSGSDRGLVITATVREPVGAELRSQASGLVAATVRRARSLVDEDVHTRLDFAHRSIAQAVSSYASIDDLYDTALVTLRGLFDADAAYIGFPGAAGEYVFARTLGIQTVPFRNLKVKYGEGLGGLARELVRPVRSLDYRHDEALRAAPVRETMDEGIYSAMAAPVVEGATRAVLYVGSRHPRAYSATDEALLAEFTDIAALTLRRADAEERSRRLVIEQERARLAQTLHDTLARKLTHIGYAAQELHDDRPDAPEALLSVISRTTEECMSLLRGQMAELLQVPSATSQTLGEVCSEILGTNGPTRSARLCQLPPTLAGRTLSPQAGAALLAVGQEAVFNAEIHGRCTQIVLHAAQHDDVVVVTIADDGIGLAAEPAMRRAGDHLGLSTMYATLAGIGGRLIVAESDQGGLSIIAELPRASFW